MSISCTDGREYCFIYNSFIDLCTEKQKVQVLGWWVIGLEELLPPPPSFRPQIYLLKAANDAISFYERALGLVPALAWLFSIIS